MNSKGTSLKYKTSLFERDVPQLETIVLKYGKFKVFQIVYDFDNERIYIKCKEIK